MRIPWRWFGRPCDFDFQAQSPCRAPYSANCQSSYWPDPYFPPFRLPEHHLWFWQKSMHQIQENILFRDLTIENYILSYISWSHHMLPVHHDSLRLIVHHFSITFAFPGALIFFELVISAMQSWSIGIKKSICLNWRLESTFSMEARKYHSTFPCHWGLSQHPSCPRGSYPCSPQSVPIALKLWFMQGINWNLF